MANEQKAKMSGDYDAYTVEDAAPPVVSVTHGIDERKLVAKIDRHVVPFLCVMYTMAYLDRINIGNATIFGLRDELGLVDNTYNTALVVFFIPYILFEIPSNILLKRFKPHVWLSINMFGFGLMTLCQGFVTNFASIVTTRVLLGIFETGMFPGAFYLIGMWYRRDEAQKRFSFFFNSTTLAGAFGGLIAAAIGKMDGTAGMRGWRWIFILEGALTIIIAVVFYFCLPGFPEDSQWLTKEEKACVVERLRTDQGESATEITFTARDYLGVFKDIRVFLGGMMYFSLLVPSYGYAYFAPTIIQSFGYDLVQTQLHSVPPWVAAFGLSMMVAYLSDRTRHRFSFAIFGILVCICGLAVLLAVRNMPNIQYAMLFLVASGAFTAMPIVVCWFNMNLGGHLRRSVGSAWQISFGNIGAIIAIFAFLKKDAPLYIPGYSIAIAFSILALIVVTAYAASCHMSNKSRNTQASAASVDHLSPEERLKLGDLLPTYRYLL
ncbi:pantothenate transporter liz1 [Colletotrichum costaricense]|uniref:Pantothenate transporter liz1 n=1 Tax=Colletotrichum costaricense TaxID=1209916 RepID=A0AAI9YLJ6_9PEZI|nr:pantothenate transporter liz1 [Colletotrichum costaricense]KAK1515350.1 pantothenate transporter liz1 [Colletotrichum costaricense]